MANINEGTVRRGCTIIIEGPDFITEATIMEKVYGSFGLIRGLVLRGGSVLRWDGHEDLHEDWRMWFCRNHVGRHESKEVEISIISGIDESDKISKIFRDDTPKKGNQVVFKKNDLLFSATVLERTSFRSRAAEELMLSTGVILQRSRLDKKWRMWPDRDAIAFYEPEVIESLGVNLGKTMIETSEDNCVFQEEQPGGQKVNLCSLKNFKKDGIARRCVTHPVAGIICKCPLKQGDVTIRMVE